MGTISKTIADEIIAGGYAEDGIVKIVTYNNQFDGALTYACVHRRENINRYEESSACRNVQTIWTEKGGVQ
jgi:hypothetical protein